MFCPECGKELAGGAWRCERCGSDLRRILKEEYWNKEEADGDSDPPSERFRLPESTVSDVGWRQIHKARRPAIVWTATGVLSLLGLVLLLYFAFRPAEMSNESTVASVDQPAAVVASVPEPVSQPEPTAPTEPASPVTEPPAPNTVAEPTAPTPPAATLPAAPPTKDEVKKFVGDWLAQWRNTASSNSVDKLKAFYSDSFKSTNNKTKAAWMKSRLMEAQGASYLVVEAGEPDIKIDGGRATVRYMQTYFSDRFSDRGTKILVIAREGSGLKIISEGFEDSTPAAKVSSSAVRESIIEWRRAWEELAIEKKLGDLPSFYHPDFRGPGGQSKNGWLDLKLKVAKKFSLIAVDVRNVRVSVLGSRAVASFNQVFKSDTYADQGVKVLTFEVRGGKPLIIRELFNEERKLQPLEVDDFWGP